MQLLREIGSKFGIARDMKLWWMIPMVSTLLLFGLLIGFGSASGLGPFIYPWPQG